MDYNQVYELYILLNPSSNLSDFETKINGILDNLEAKEIELKNEGLKKLAYPINKHLSGNYLLINYSLDLKNTKKLNSELNKLVKDESVLRFLNINTTEFNKLKEKEKLNQSSEFATHRDLNKGKSDKKRCFVKYVGMKAVDYKNVEFLNQFVSPYSKIFSRTKTGTSAKMQRKVAQAIKRARYMGLISFTNKWIAV
jgi:small subunit ribosomal protein S18